MDSYFPSNFDNLKNYKNRQENRICLKYKFVGRWDELKGLHEFLESGSEKIKLIAGSGSVGKTRLALEFAAQVENNGLWTVYFINPFKEFHPIPIINKTLFILDEPSRCKEKDKIIDFVENPPSIANDIKLLLIDRPIFRDALESDLRQKGVNIEKTMVIERGNIIEFLKENFKDIEENIAKKIEDLCEDSFLYAAFYAENFKETGELNELKVILAEKTEKYLKDLANRLGKNLEDVKKGIYLISLIAPIEWTKDKACLIDAKIFSNDYNTLEDLVGLSESYHNDILFISDGKCMIKPDPVADYLRSEFLKQSFSDNLINKLMSYMPFRISYNISVITRFDKRLEQNMLKKLDKIWINLNHDGAKNPEYFWALLLFTGNFKKSKHFDKYNLDIIRWIENFNDLSHYYPKTDMLRFLTSSLVNVTSHYGKDAKFDEMKHCLFELEKLYNGNLEVKDHFSMGLFCAMNSYGQAAEFELMGDYLEKLYKLHLDYPESPIIRISLAEGLYNGTSYFGRNGNFGKMEDCLQKMTELERKYPERDMLYHLTISLFNAIDSYMQVKNSKKMESCLEVLRKLNQENLETFVKYNFAESLFGMVSYSGQELNFEKMEGYLDELRKLYQEYFGIEVRVAFAKSLVNAIANYEGAETPEKIEICLVELRNLQSSCSEKEIRCSLACGLYNALKAYGKFKDYGKMVLCLDDLRELCKNHPDNEIIDILARSLFDSITYYIKPKELEKIEQCLEELLQLNKTNSTNELRINLAKSLINAQNCHLKVNFLEELRLIYRDFPGKEIRGLLAIGLLNSILADKEGNKLEKMITCLAELHNLHQTYREIEVREFLAYGLFNVIITCINNKEIEKMDHYIKELRQLHKAYPEKVVRIQFAVSLFNLILFCSRVIELEKMKHSLEDLSRLHQDYPEKEVREELTKSLVNVISCYGRIGIFDLMKRHLEELCQLYENYSETKVRMDLARGLVNAISICGHKADLGYEKLLLLYKLRFDLPNDSHKNKTIHDIEIVLIKETENVLRMKNEGSVPVLM